MNNIHDYISNEYDLKQNPTAYSNLLAIVNSVQSDAVKSSVKYILSDLTSKIEKIESTSESLSAATRSLEQESHIRSKTKKQSVDLEAASDEDEQFGDINYISVLSFTFEQILQIYSQLNQITTNLTPRTFLTNEHFKDASYSDKLAEINMNGSIISNYVNNIALLKVNTNAVDGLAQRLYGVLEHYYRMILNRHTVQGIKIYTDPIITDVALNIYKNVDSSGEVETLNNGNKISAYTLRKAEILAKSIKDPIVFNFINQPDHLIDFIKASLSDISQIQSALLKTFESQLNDIESNFGPVTFKKSQLKDILITLDALNPRDVSYIEPTKLVSDTEKLISKIKDETLSLIVEKLLDQQTNFKSLVDYIISRKTELKEFFHNENSFYTCKIGAGNPFSGEAPGALEVVPAEKPKGDMKWILGEGFDEVRKFSESIESAAKFHNIFLATSPSKTADKSNVLLIGPPGCGKTEVMRAVGADTKSISIFAQASDFGTAWANESDKNVKRLFEEGMKLNNESGKHVHFLIDEIDAVLNDDKSHGKLNLTLEFQILMDGIVRYPNLSVWGATNFPQRIPMAMMRRFSKVLIVGELSHDDRKKLLKHFLGHMPINKIKESEWDIWSEQLIGSTGDVIRKIADFLWREKMNQFVIKKPQVAEELVSSLTENGIEFNLNTFNREDFKLKLRPHVLITSNDINRTIDTCLRNVSISAEIQTAIETYTNAKILLHGLKK